MPTDTPSTIVITRWNETFENADTRKRQRLKSFHCPSGIESRGLVNLLCHFKQERALMAFGVFQMLCQLSATLPADHRGRLIHSDGTPMTAEYLSHLLRVEICHLYASLEALADKRVGWISMEGENNDLPPICQSSPGFVQGEGEGEGEAPHSPPRGLARKDWAEKIYSAYPQKKGRRAALTAIENALRRGADPEHVERQTVAFAAFVAQWPAADQQRFIPNPATWFNQDRFDDDPNTWVRGNAAPIKPKPQRTEHV